MIIERKILFGLDDIRALVFECGGDIHGYPPGIGAIAGYPSAGGTGPSPRNGAIAGGTGPSPGIPRPGHKP